MFNLFKAKTENHLCLSDYNKIWSKFCFLDESGSLNDRMNPFFTIGMIKCSQPYYLYSKLLYERAKYNFHDEMKFNKLSKLNITFLKLAIDLFLEARSTFFYSYTLDKEGQYFRREFNADQWRAYEQITVRLLTAALGGQENEILILIADHMTCPKHVKYEVTVKNEFNQLNCRLALAGVCRFDSKGNDLIQIVDLIIGAVNYDLKLALGFVSGDKYKIEFVKHIKNQLGVGNFCDGFRNKMFNIFVDKDHKQRLPIRAQK